MNGVFHVFESSTSEQSNMKNPNLKKVCFLKLRTENECDNTVCVLHPVIYFEYNLVILLKQLRVCQRLVKGRVDDVMFPRKERRKDFFALNEQWERWKIACVDHVSSFTVSCVSCFTTYKLDSSKDTAVFQHQHKQI